ncbi:MAG: hypothetical protein EOP88_04670 [Verrucomicrobiaceae bacterium]|nr:MAG: hypothetical protein EOP88_04670 [Verrucomicrobiaceae bacterium]
MSLPEHKTIRTALIPWIVAIVALIGLNALASVHRFTKKDESSHESAISELSDEVVAGIRVSEPLVYIEPAAAEEKPSALVWTPVPHVAAPGVFISTGVRIGGVQGRAPPVQREI